MSTDYHFCVTGHRPPRLGLGYTQDDNLRLTRFARERLSLLAAELDSPAFLVAGMAQGWDQACAEAALNMGWLLVAAVPFQGQESKWPDEAQRRYYDLLDRAWKVHVVCPGGYSPRKFIRRDRWMVDHAAEVLALWDRTQKGGTWDTVSYARSLGRPLRNAWDAWKAAPV
jgi:uncharacterized phage-like protein YoqJ